jgi:hypothetical protein
VLALLIHRWHRVSINVLLILQAAQLRSRTMSLPLTVGETYG